MTNTHTTGENYKDLENLIQEILVVGKQINNSQGKDYHRDEEIQQVVQSVVLVKTLLSLAQFQRFQSIFVRLVYTPLHNIKILFHVLPVNLREDGRRCRADTLLNRQE